MSFLKSKIIILPIVLSVTFAALLMPAIIDRYGAGGSMLIVMLGMAVIWVMFLAWGWIINSIVDHEIRRRAAGRRQSRL